MRRSALMLAGFVILLTLGVTAQESRSEISLQGTGFFTKDTNGQGIQRTTTDTGGFFVGYFYHLQRLRSVRTDYCWGPGNPKEFFYRRASFILHYHSPTHPSARVQASYPL